MGKQVNVVFIEDKKGFFRLGEEKNVAYGYAFNYLIPQELAVVNNKGNQTFIDSVKKKTVKHQEKLKTEAKKVHDVLHNQTVTLSAKAHDEGKLYGSISVNNIISEINKNFEITIDKYDFKEFSPIKQLGNYHFFISIHADIETIIKVIVEQEKEDVAVSSQKEKQKRKNTSSIETYADTDEDKATTAKKEETKKETSFADDIF